MKCEGKADATALAADLWMGVSSAVFDILAAGGGRLQHLEGSDRPAQLLSGGCFISQCERVLAPQLQRVDVQLAGDLLHLALDCENRLGHAEAAESSVGRGMSRHHATVDPACRPAVGAGGVKHSARCHHRRERAVSPAVHDDVDFAPQQRPIFCHRRSVFHHCGVALGGRRDVFIATVDHLHRSTGLAREQGRVAGDHRRVFLLAPETPAGDRLNHRNPVFIELQQPLQGPVHIEGALHRTVERDAPVFARHGADGIGLDVHLLLMADEVRALDDSVGVGESLGESVGAALESKLLEHLRRLEGIQHCLQWLDLHPDVGQRLLESLSIGRSQQGNRLLAVSNDAFRQTRLIVLDQVDHVLSGNIPGRHAGDSGPIESGVKLQLADAPVGHAGAHGPAPKLAREAEVVEVEGPASHLVQAVLARG